MSISRHIVHGKQPVHLFSLVYGDNDNKDGTMSFFLRTHVNTTGRLFCHGHKYAYTQEFSFTIKCV